MNISRLFILRPVMTTLVMLALLLAGVLGYQKLPVNDLPNVDLDRKSTRLNSSHT